MYPAFKRIYTRSNQTSELFIAVLYGVAFVGIAVQWWLRLGR